MLDRLPVYLRDKVCVTPGCWLWTGHLRKDGYGTYSQRHGRYKLAHRIVYAALTGEIPEGAVLHHVCENTSCVNPAHLQVMPQSRHVLIGSAPPAIHSRKTHCIRGHPFDEANTYRWTDRKGRVGRMCKTCRNNNNKRFYHESKRKTH